MDSTRIRDHALQYRKLNGAFVTLDQQVLKRQLSLDTMLYQFQGTGITVFWVAKI